MNFIGRKTEFAELEEHYQRPSGFVVICGRRRVGKTTLIKEFIKNKSALYFVATTENEEINMQNFQQQLAKFPGNEYLQYTDKIKINAWDTLFALFAKHNPAQKKILAIDEFQYLAEINPAFPTIFQKAWDETLSKSNIMVILCGSYISLMEKYTLSPAAALYGRSTALIKLQPLTFAELSAHYTDKTFAELVNLYAITGGVPIYLEFFDNGADIFENIRRYILNKNGSLYEAPLLIFEKEVKGSKMPVTYLSILKSIANGKTRRQEIAADLQMKETALSPYLATLISLHLIERRVPITVRAPEHSKNGKYYIQDGFFKFWFLFVSPNKSELEMGRSDAVLERIRPQFIDRFVSFAYENICRELFWDLCRNKKIPFEPLEVGGFWNRKNVEIDVAAIDRSQKKLFVGECKFHSGDKVVDMRVYNDLQEKCQLVSEFAKYEIVYGLFSATGFDMKLKEKAKANPNLYLIEKDPISAATNASCTVKDHCNKVYGDYGTEPVFTVGVYSIKNADLFQNVIEYGSSLRNISLPDTYYKKSWILAVSPQLDVDRSNDPGYQEYLKDRKNQINNENCRNDWITFHLVVEGVTNEWSYKILRKSFGNIDVERFIKKRAEILSYAAKISNASCTVKDHCNKVYGDYGTEPVFTVGVHRIKNADLFQNVIEYGSSLQDRYIPDLENCRNDWFTFRLIAEGVANEWSIETLQDHFGDDDVDQFIKKRAEILSYAEKTSKNAEQYLKEIENGSSTETGV